MTPIERVSWTLAGLGNQNGLVVAGEFQGRCIGGFTFVQEAGVEHIALLFTQLIQVRRLGEMLGEVWRMGALKLDRIVHRYLLSPYLLISSRENKRLLRC